MPTRREFVQCTAAVPLLAALPAVAKAEPPGPMARRNFPGAEESIGVIGLGNSSPFFEGDMPRSRELIKLLLDHGGNYVDTAGQSRFTLGKIMTEQNAHEQLFLGTYVQVADLATMREEIEQVQAGQGGGALDLVQTFSPRDMLARRDELLRLREDGLTRHIGVGRHNQRYFPDIMTLINEGIVDVIQINYSMLEPEAADEILPLALEKEIAVFINRAFVNGEYFNIVRGQELPAWAAEFDCDSWAQFSLKFILAHPAVSCVLTETSNPRHAVDNLGAGYGRLPDQAMRDKMLNVMRQLV